ncbi:MAG: DHH family phosphoesterase, partial [Clostridia bacterium]|nr:DHH family phosphoesterase [Clostridia bacterium]
IKKEIDISKNKNLKGDIQREIKIGDSNYNLIGKYAKSKNRDKNDKYIITLYFINETEKVKLAQKYIDSKICVGIIMIDNYEEIMQRVSSEDRPQLIAQIEKNVYDWVMKFDGMIVKSERDTFVCIFEQRNLNKIEESKFNILDIVKQIKIPGIMQSTLSIAITNEGELNSIKYKSALATMDIALGRGGDQAVVRKDGKYIFYGGKSQEIEKRTRVKARIVAHALEELIQKSENVIIMGHVNGDIDSMGSSLGVYRIAKSLGKETYILNETYGLALKKIIEALAEEEEYNQVIINKNEALMKINRNTLLIIVDTHKAGFVEEPELISKTNKIVVIDHHRRGEDYILNAILTFHEVYASSAAELVTELIEYSENEIKLTKVEAEALYAGIMMDTKNFTFKTGVRTFEAAAFLRKSGVDIIKVKKWFQSDLKTYNQISDIVGKAEIYRKTIAISINEVEEKDVNLICAKSADELLTISDITASFVIGKIGSKVYISGRSIGDINVQVILEKLRRRRSYYASWCTT